MVVSIRTTTGVPPVTPLRDCPRYWKVSLALGVSMVSPLLAESLSEMFWFDSACRLGKVRVTVCPDGLAPERTLTPLGMVRV